MPRLALTRLISISLLLLLTPAAFGQLSLTGSGSYTQGFNSIGGGLPTGWSVRLFAGTTSLGTDVTGGGGYRSTNTSWGTAGQFANYASALNPGLDGSEPINIQSQQNDRALGVRQMQDFGDPGAAFTLQLANTTGFQDFNLSFSAQLLSVEGKNTVYTVRYGIGATPSSFTALGMINTGTLNGGTTFGEDPFTVGPAALAGINDVNDTVWLQVVALSLSTGSGSDRDTFAIDNVQLTYTPVPEPGTVLAIGAAGLGLAGLARRRRPTP